jgi:hypothetical protein
VYLLIKFRSSKAIAVEGYRTLVAVRLLLREYSSDYSIRGVSL